MPRMCASPGLLLRKGRELLIENIGSEVNIKRPRAICTGISFGNEFCKMTLQEDKYGIK